MPENSWNLSDIEADKDPKPITRLEVILLVSVILISVGISLFYFPSHAPLKLDAVAYYSYAISVSKTGFPAEYLTMNEGWPLALSFFFWIFRFENMFDLMNLQRVVSILFTNLTIIPLFFLLRLFAKNKIAIVGVALFGFNPRIIENSLFGITEPLYIFLITVIIYSVIRGGRYFIFCSFMLTACASVVRYEGLLLFIPLTASFFLRNNVKKKSVITYLIASGIFLLVVTPVAVIRTETFGQDGFISHIIGNERTGGAVRFLDLYVIQGIPELDDPIPGKDFENKASSFIVISLNSMAKFLVLSSLPYFTFLVPFGFFLFYKKSSTKLFISLLLFLFFLSLPALYAYGRGIEETRYLFTLFPLYCIFSVFTINRIFGKKIQTLQIISLSVIILTLSIIFLNYTILDFGYEMEVYNITREIVAVANGVNNYYGSGYAKVAELEKNWPDLPHVGKLNKIIVETKRFNAAKFNSLDEMIISSRKDGLTHLVISDDYRSPQYIRDILHNETNYQYLEKIFDSREHEYKNTILIFKINYQKFEQINNSEIKN